MKLKEYLEEQIKIYSNFLENVDGITILTSDIPRFKSTIRLFRSFLNELEELKEPKWSPVIGEYCWFIECGIEGDLVHLCKVVDIYLRTYNNRYNELKEERIYRVATTTGEVHEGTLEDIEKFDGTLPSVIRIDND